MCTGVQQEFTRNALGFTPDLTNAVGKKRRFLFWCVSEWTLWEKAMWAEQNSKASGSKAEKARRKGIWLISLPWESRVRDCQFVFKLAAPIAQSRMLAGQFPRHLICPSLHLYEKARWNFQNCRGILSQSEVWRENTASSGSGISLRSLGRSHPSLLTQDRAEVLNLPEPLCSLLLPEEDWAMALLRLAGLALKRTLYTTRIMSNKLAAVPRVKGIVEISQTLDIVKRCL